MVDRVFLHTPNERKLAPDKRKPVRKATNLSLNAELLKQARDLKIVVSRAAEAGLAQAVAKEKERLWLEENRHAIESSNDFVEQHGLPLARHRRF